MINRRKFLKGTGMVLGATGLSALGKIYLGCDNPTFESAILYDTTPRNSPNDYRDFAPKTSPFRTGHVSLQTIQMT